MSLRVLCDTNVLVSAFVAGGPPSRVIERVIDGHLEFVLAEPVMKELERILTVKLGFEPPRWEQVDELLRDLAQESIAAPKRAPEPVTGDAPDDRSSPVQSPPKWTFSSPATVVICSRSANATAFA